MNKKFIEFVEKHTNWEWNEETKDFMYPRGLYNDNYTMFHHAKPEDLLGWKIAFLEKHKYWVDSTPIIDGGTFIQIYQEGEFHSIIDELGKTYKEAFDAAWEKFIELIGE